ncbi:hypothetical protein GCM10027037_05640 [Mucilaginibacter koreensis]
MKLRKKQACALLACALTAGIYAGCKPEKFGNGNGLDAPNLSSSFTATPLANKPNYYILKADEAGVTSYKWDLGDGGGSNKGSSIDTAFFPDAGKYTVTLSVSGAGGTVKTSSKDITIANSDPKSGNLVLGAKMQTGDDAYWKHITISPGVTMTMTNGKMVAIGGNSGHAAVYQPINVVAGQKYKVDMVVSGSGATDTWFEVYVGTDVPKDGQDYSSGGKLISLNTWSGCGKSNFSGKLSSLSCDGPGNTITFKNSGVVYLVIKSGGANLGTTGISFSNVELRGVN